MTGLRDHLRVKQPKPRFVAARKPDHLWEITKAGIALVPFIGGVLHYARRADVSLPILQLELAFDAATARTLVKSAVGAFEDAVRADFTLILAYTATLLLACGIAFTQVRSGRGRKATVVAAVLALVVAACDLGENSMLLRGLESLSRGGGDDSAFLWAGVLASAKFVLLVPVVVTAIIGLALAVRRGVRGLREERT